MGVQVSHCSQSPLTPDLMMFNFLLLVTLLTLATASPVEVESTETKASSPLINCGCQCSSLTFRDANGVVQGNCLTVDSTGAQWCYVDQAYSSCQDLVPSRRFPNNPWSYEACATPTLWLPPLSDLWKQWAPPSRKYLELTEVTILSLLENLDREMLPARVSFLVNLIKY